MGITLDRKKIALTVLFGLIISLLFVVTLTAEAYTRVSAGSVWDEDRMITEFGGPRYSCIGNSSCLDDNSASVRQANSTRPNPYLQFKCVDGNICQDQIHTELKYIKSIVGPGSRLGNALIPSVTSFRIYDQSGNDVTYDECIAPGSKLEFVIASEHRTCGTRALMTHYEIRFADQSANAAKGGWASFVNNFTGGFNFVAPLEEGEYEADVAIINPTNPWYYYRGFGVGSFEKNKANARSSYYTYELGRHTVNICPTDDSTLRASCFASPVQVLPGRDVTFNARVTGGVGPYTYSWDGDTEGETVTTQYPVAGAHSKRLSVTDSAGNSAETTCSVSVVNDEGANLDWTSGTGWSWSYGDAFIPFGEIEYFRADKVFTNDSCNFEWKTQGMASCRILSSNQESFIEVDVTGSKDLEAGVHTLECFDAISLDSIKSQPVRCVDNPNVREI